MAADETRTIIIDVEVPEKDFEKEIGKVNTALRKNKEEIKELSKDYENNATAISKLDAENRDLAKSKQQLIKESKTESNSLNALRLRVANLTKERNNLDISSKEGVARFKELNKQILENTDTLKEAEEAGGDFRRSVGNYSKGIGEAVSGTQVFGTTLGSLFRLLLANPIILVVTALAALVKVFSETQAGAEFFRKTGAALNASLGLLKDIVEFLGVELIKLFDDPVQSIKDFANLIKENIINRFEGLIELIPQLAKAINLLFKLEFAEAGKVALDAVAKVTLGVENFTEKVTESIVAVVEFAKQISIASDTAFGLENRLIANEKALADLRVEQAQSIKSQKELNLIIEDQTKSFEERLKAGQEFADNEAAQISKAIELQKEQIEILKAQNDITNSREEDIQRVRDAEIELANLQAASFERALTNNNKLFGIRQQQEAERQKVFNQEITDIQILAAAEAEAADQQDKEELSLLKLKDDANKQIVSGTLSLLGELGGAGKIAAVAQAGINIAQGITKAIAQGGIAGLATGAIVGAAGLVQLNKIRNTEVPGGGSGGNASVSIPSGNGVSQVSGLANVNASLLSQFSTPAQNQADQNAAIIEGISNMPQATVAVVEINKAQDNRAVKVGEAELG